MWSGIGEQRDDGMHIELPLKRQKAFGSVICDVADAVCSSKPTQTEMFPKRERKWNAKYPGGYKFGRWSELWWNCVRCSCAVCLFNFSSLPENARTDSMHKSRCRDEDDIVRFIKLTKKKHNNKPPKAQFGSIVVFTCVPPFSKMFPYICNALSLGSVCFDQFSTFTRLWRREIFSYRFVCSNT